MKLLIALLLITTFVACRSKAKKSEVTSIPTLELQWETDTLMTTCESVIYDKSSGLIYVANINNKPWEIDYNGFISTLDTDGNIVDLVWLKEDLSGPKGMGILNGTLYINDINRIVEVDMATKAITKSYYLDGSPALNDITISPEGRLFSSESASSIIYELSQGHLKKVGNTPDGRLNGLLAVDGKLYFTLAKLNQFGTYDLDMNTIKILTEDIGWSDGIVKLKNGDFITSSWAGEIYYIKASDWSRTLLLDTKDENINAADIDYIPELDLIIVPTFFHNTVRAYKISY
jgi:hypothetical protein